MKVTITRLRQDLFKLADRALEGEAVEFTYKGVVFTMTPEIKRRKLERLSGQTVVAVSSDLERASRELLREMQSEWEKDWAEL